MKSLTLSGSNGISEILIDEKIIDKVNNALGVSFGLEE